jgi:Fic family protein
MGNGRTGRILNILYLIETGLLELPVLYLSGAIIRRKAEYYRLLRDVTESGAWEPFLLYMLTAIDTTARATTTLIRRMRQLMEDTANRVRSDARSIYSRELVELIFTHPYCRIRNVVEAGLAQRQRASVHLGEIAEIGVLEEFRAGREKLFLNTALLQLLHAAEKRRDSP